MATAIYVPRINNNDDEVKVLAFDVAIGSKVENGQIVGQVETDKAVLDVTAAAAGFVLGFVANPDEVVKVGSVMLWLGENVDEAIPEPQETSLLRSTAKNSEITAKARLLLAQNGLQAELVTPIDGRITVEAVERYLAAQGGAKAEATKATESRATDVLPDVAGNQVSLSREEKGMAATVTWHRDFAVAGYIEIEYELNPWVEYAKDFQDKNSDCARKNAFECLHRW